MDGKDSVAATFGPLTVSRETCNLFMKTILDTKPWRQDPSLTVKPWTTDAETLGKKLKIAIEWDDGVVKPHPPAIRAMKEVKEACEKAGHTVVDWVPFEHAKAWDIISELYFPDGGEAAYVPLKASGEPILPLTKYIIDEQPCVKNHNMHEYWELCSRRDAYREAYALHWSATGDPKTGEGEVDVIICPTTPGVAPLHDTARYWPYTSQWNLLDYPACVFPVGFVEIEKDPKEEGYTPMNEKDKYNYELYSPEKYVGAPISLTLVGRRYMDEKVMAALEVVEKAMGRE